ncbi:glyoxalase/bleomycin resistance protein/dioxygenase [Halorubrum californiense DSM 19288]|uniref:Glyoxalase/bleomycin resistance protein/dioxygenase n=1 Tax=Halorubrum californiense DSM 19288 TaxID=1227465 RepID=M0DYI9_9EURY|nr:MULTISPECIES: VOC family protein [Halorubrum]ELZ40600.1 glyoxalase/bleomycin resistance protein/dioxygenase [Halorubrum californiense DSM 19288]TKX66508.1 VOC family protein [Halorubrum sp. GN11GM_10-3_MGM]
MEILHTCLNVADADRAADWYVDELGFERSWEFTTAGGDARNVYVADENGVEFQLSDAEGETPSADGDRYDHVAVGVDDVDAAFDEIDHHGVVEPPTDHPEAGARVAFVEDPDGHVVEVIEPL